MKTTRKTSLKELTRGKVIQLLSGIVKEMQNAEKKFSPQLTKLHANFKVSGTNLIHYMVLRSSEIREIQEYLHHEGLSSLTNSESHTLFQLVNVLHWLKHQPPLTKAPVCNFEMASRLRQVHAEQLLGVLAVQDRPHIMVTFSVEMLEEPKLMEDMLNAGMSVARINCAHDSKEIWLKMILLLRKSIAKTGKNCLIYMDIAGPKIRIKGISSKKQNQNTRLKVAEGKSLVLTYAADRGTGHKKQRKVESDTLYIEPKELLSMVKVGEHIFFDDGKFEAKVLKVKKNQVDVEIIRISAKKHFLKPEKGINLPDSDITIPPLTEEDKRNIPFICKYADLVGYSFVSNTEDVDLLREEINKYATDHRPAIVLKIERLSAVQNLPSLLMNGMRDGVLGVMIARGDLAVEIGFERMSEIQEEILWICEAAHVPVIWATQVLETLNQTGYATRSEITDAAMGVRSECVMLNKGKYIIKTIQTLEDILTRQLGHVHKKRYIMRPLGIARTFIQP